MNDTNDTKAIGALRRFLAEPSAADQGPDYGEAFARATRKNGAATSGHRRTDRFESRVVPFRAPRLRLPLLAASCASVVFVAALGFCGPDVLGRRADPSVEIDHFVNDILHSEEFKLRTVLADAY